MSTGGPLALQNSQSAFELSPGRDMIDSSDQLYIPRSSSLGAMSSYSEHQRIIITEFNEEQAIAELTESDAGAARLRDMPLRKTKLNRVPNPTTTTTTTASSAAGAATTSKRGTRASSRSKQIEIGAGDQGIRGRRKLREPTPDVDVEGD